jgi:predicted ATPase
VPLTSFVGRDAELDRLAELSSARLVTILGPGGTGKTRLALEHANRDKRAVSFVDLSSVVSSAVDVAHAVIGTLGLRETGFAPASADPVARLRRFAAGLDRDRLLILDNCEQVVAAVAGLARTLIEAGDRLSILATSREPLAITGETLLVLAPLPSHSAERLFADRAAAVRPTFDASSDADAVRAICAAVDGLPLAIELAAARLRQFTVPQIAARLAADEHFRLLSRGDRTAAERHRTLHAVVNWSWGLLGPEEQALARRLAAFSGGASTAAVHAVCGFSEDRLADLVDKSLVETDGERYRMLDTIRLFGLDRLAEAGEADDVRRAHARYLLGLAREADPHLLRAEQLDWLARLGADHDNFLAALRWSVRHDRETAYGLVAALATYGWLGGRRGEVGALAAALLAGGLVQGLEEEYVSCVVHAVPRPASEHWDRAAHIMRTLDHELRHSFGTAAWAMATGPPSTEVELEPRLGFCPWTRALHRLGSALLDLLSGRPTSAEAQLLAVLDQFTAIGERWGIAQCLDWLAVVAGWRGDWARADESWTSALAALEELGAAQESADVLAHRAESLIRRGDLDGAGAAYRRAASLAESQPGAGVLLGQAVLVRLRGGPPPEAMALLDRAFELASAGGPPAEPAKAGVLTERARLTGDVALHRAAVAVARGCSSCWLADAVEGLAESLAGRDAVQSAQLLGAAVGLRGMAVAGQTGAARAATVARETLGDERFECAFADGLADPLTIIEE